ncbi:tyrosyl-DNA phosphodiesterase domain protein [Paecilomyces variotii No. 5]|uniref:Tyrosyl-DNA phosphodiesterase domain protein n=1 Tax=Byssochlamys spectabilis (strain No. 5 / NBRC 109023) TaxID=1356009 RepID=V5HQA9_BYSSN|nr:tyrosyl-DNA phosphodiesterase domain protein [Paecilomyces variotii No. 5]
MESEDLTDPDLRAAIAASLRDLQSSPSNPVSSSRGQGDIVDLTADSDDDELNAVAPKSKSTVGSETDDEEDEELRKAIALSMQEGDDIVSTHKKEPSEKAQNKGNDNATVPPAVADEATPSGSDPKPSGIMGIDRKQMEQERLARLAKRKAEGNISPPQISRQNKMAKQYTEQSVPKLAAAGQRLQHSETGAHQKKTDNPFPQPSSVPSIQFPKGVVKKTWALGYPRDGNDTTIEEVLQKSDLELAVLSSFMWDMEWLFSKLDTRNTRFLLVMQAKEEETKRQYEAETSYMKNLRLCFPPMEGQVNCMHSKLMLLFHPNYLRIAVPSANLTSYDWGELGVMENSVFIIDLPKKQDQTSTQTQETPFYRDLVYFLSASTLHANVISKLDAFDFSETASFAFVHTIGGSHAGSAWRKTGLCGLGRAISSLGLRTSKPLNIDFVTSSVGSLTDQFLRSIYLACQGDDGLTEFTLRNSKTFPAKSRGDPNILIKKDTGQESKDRFRVYFPSDSTVRQSRGGPQCAGTICFQSKWFQGPNFPRYALRDCVSRRDGLLMHNKMIFARPDEPITLADGSRCQAWAYLGSANLSESAWGRLVQNRTTKEPKLNCRNWECGVVIPIPQQGTKAETSGSLGAASNEKPSDERKNEKESDFAPLFETKVPVPMKLPGRPYGPGMKPWYYMES